jgi:hypothetical protein
MEEVPKSAKALLIALPKCCRGQMSEERPTTRQGFFSRLFSRDDGREGRGMITRSVPVPLRNPICRVTPEGDPLHSGLSAGIAFVR